MATNYQLAKAQARYEQAKSEYRRLKAEIHVTERKLHDALNGVRREA